MNVDDNVLQGVSKGRARQSGSSVIALRDTKKHDIAREEENNYCESSAKTKTVGMGCYTTSEHIKIGTLHEKAFQSWQTVCRQSESCLSRIQDESIRTICKSVKIYVVRTYGGNKL